MCIVGPFQSTLVNRPGHFPSFGRHEKHSHLKYCHDLNMWYSIPPFETNLLKQGVPFKGPYSNRLNSQSADDRPS